MGVLRDRAAMSEPGSVAEMSNAHRLVGALLEYWEPAEEPEGSTS
jgi:hypothetical protein